MKDARTLAHDLLAMDQPEFSAAFKGSPMKRAKRRGLARNAAVALGNIGTVDDFSVLEAALAHDEPLVREHAAWALRRLGRDHDAPPPLSDTGDADPRRASAVRR